MIPTEVLDECRAKAKAKVAEGNTLGWIGASVIVTLWILALGFAFVLGRRLFFKFRFANGMEPRYSHREFAVAPTPLNDYERQDAGFYF